MIRPTVSAIEALIRKLERIQALQYIDAELSAHVPYLQANFELEVAVTDWVLVRPVDWRFREGHWIETSAICADILDGPVWWADHTCKELFSAAADPAAGAHRPASYWARLGGVISDHKAFQGVSAWLENIGCRPLHHRYRTGLRKEIEAVKRNLAEALLVEALELPDQVIEISARLDAAFPYYWEPPSEMLSPATIQHIWRNIEQYARIQRETPNHLLAFRVSAYGSGPGPWANSAQELKERLMQHDITDYGWRLLVRHGPKLLEPFFNPKTPANGSLVRLVEALRIHQTFRDGRLVPVWFISYLLRLLRERKGGRIQAGWQLLPPKTLRLACERAMLHKSFRSRDLLREDVRKLLSAERLLRSVTGSKSIDDITITKWRERVATAESWAVLAVEDRDELVRRFEFVEVLSNETLADVARQLGNCLNDKELPKDLRSQFPIFSIKMAGLPIYLGAVTYNYNADRQSWSIFEIKGPANLPAPPHLRAAAYIFAEELPPPKEQV